MKGFKGTKGEWKVISNEVDRFEIVGVQEGFKNILSNDIDFGTQKANAKLIAAAPDLLKACQRALNIVDLWAPNYSDDQIKEEHIGELAALSMMRQGFEKAIQKALK